jgi:hypothetical protein
MYCVHEGCVGKWDGRTLVLGMWVWRWKVVVVGYGSCEVR